MLAYLVIREGSKWTDVFRLLPDESVTIGRAPTNKIVIKDERCSRCHAEVFLSQGTWTLRDLESRNGTVIGSERVRGDYLLRPGDVIRIGQSQLVFVHDLAKAFPDSSHLLRPGVGADETVTKMILPDEYGDSADVLAGDEPATITHRRGQTKFLEPHEEVEEGDKEIPRLGRAAATLCRLAFALAKAPDVRSLADVALTGLFGETHVDAGALLLLPRDFEGEVAVENLEIVASRSASELPYHRVPNFLASTVLREGEAVLARNAMGDSTLGSRDSEGQLHATSVLCARSAAASG